MTLQASRRDLFKLAGAGAALPHFELNAGGAREPADELLRAWIPSIVSQLQIEPSVAFAVLRRLAKAGLRPTVMVEPGPLGQARINAATPYLRSWQLASDKITGSDVLGRSCVLVNDDAITALSSPQVIFRCYAGCSFANVTVFQLRSRLAEIAMITAKSNLPLIKSLQFSEVPIQNNQ